jgi:hypothetical protein
LFFSSPLSSVGSVVAIIMFVLLSCQKTVLICVNPCLRKTPWL